MTNYRSSVFKNSRNPGPKGMLTGQSWTATTDATGAAKFAAVKTGSTYATGWSFSASSLATTIVTKETAAGATTATETGRWTQSFNVFGDVSSIKNAKTGLTARVAQLDIAGQALGFTDFAGDVYSMTYTPRGRLAAIATGASTWRYRYTPFDRVSEIEAPGGALLRFNYSASHDLIDATEVAGTGATAKLPSSSTRGLSALLDFSNVAKTNAAQPAPAPDAPPPSEPADLAPCKYYAGVCKKTGCRYYCSTAPNMCAYGGWLPPFWDLGVADLNCIRRCLVRSDTEERKKLPQARCKDCLPDSAVDRDHEKCYPDCQVSPRRSPV